MAFHARRSASKAKRFLNCFGSVAAEAAVPDELKRGSNEFGDEGTAAHALLERVAKLWLKPRDPAAAEPTPFTYIDLHWIGVDAKGNTKWFDHKPRLFEFEGRSFPVNSNMAEAVNVTLETMKDEIERLGGLKQCTVTLEKTWDLTWLHPDLGGTSDITIDLFLDELVIIDHKHGKSPKGAVDVIDEFGTPNEQLAIYLLGAAHAGEFSHDRYKIIVSQPRAPHIDGPVRELTLTRQQLLDFKAAVEHAMKEIDKPNAPLRAGSWCSYCDAAPECQELRNGVAERVTAGAAADFDELPPENFSPIETANPSAEAAAIALGWAPIAEAWAKAVKLRAQRIAETGVKVPGQKLVQGKTHRKWKATEAEVLEALADAIDDPKRLIVAKLITPAAAEKLSKEAKAILKAKDQDLWFNPPGKITLAPDSDPRPEINIGDLAGQDFADDLEDDE